MLAWLPGRYGATTYWILFAIVFAETGALLHVCVEYLQQSKSGWVVDVVRRRPAMPAQRRYDADWCQHVVVSPSSGVHLPQAWWSLPSCPGTCLYLPPAGFCLNHTIF